MTSDTTDWKELREFKGVDLTASYVLSWQVEGEALLLDLDLCLLPEHAFYEKPRRKDAGCIFPAVLEFPYCSQLRSADVRADAGTINGVASRLGLGRIRGMQRTGDGIYRLRGQFGSITVHAERPLLRLKNLSR